MLQAGKHCPYIYTYDAYGTLAFFKRNKAAIAEVAEELAGDIGEESFCEALIAEVIARFGQLDILVNNAAITKDGLALRMKREDWDAVLSTNLTGAFLVSKAAIPLIARSGGGSVVLIASQLARVGSSRRAVYCAIKGGLLNLARAMAIDHAPEKIRVNTLSPGAIETDRMPLRFGTMEAAREALGPLHLTGTLGQPEDIASAAIYLASDASSFVTGADLLVDGGYTAR